MITPKNKAAALLMAGLSLYGSLMMTTALAGPTKGKKPTKKPPVKKDTKKEQAKLVADGKKVYDSNGCSNCHKVGDKGGATGPELTKVAADAKHTSKWFEAKVTNPKASNPDSTMPAYEETIKGKDLKALAAYLSTLKK